MKQSQLEALLAELYLEIDDVYSLQAELELLEYLDDVGYSVEVDSEAA